MTLWSIGSIGFLAVESYEGFDRPQTATLVTLLSDGTSTRNQVLQQGATPFSQATVTGTLTEAADVAALRAYYHSKETVTFTDPNGVSTDVRVLELSVVDVTLWWEFTMTLLESDEGAVSQPGTALAAASVAGDTNVKVGSVARLTSDGDFVRIGYLGRYETRELTAVGTAGSGGTGLDFADPLLFDHALAERVVEVTGA